MDEGSPRAVPVVDYAPPPPHVKRRRRIVRWVVIWASIFPCAWCWIDALSVAARDADWKRSGGEAATGYSLHRHLLYALDRAIVVTTVVVVAWCMFVFVRRWRPKRIAL